MSSCVSRTPSTSLRFKIRVVWSGWQVWPTWSDGFVIVGACSLIVGRCDTVIAASSYPFAANANALL